LSGVSRRFAADTRLPCVIHPAVNVEPRRGAGVATLLILHYTGMLSAAKAVDWLAREESRVSCHYVVDEAGGITQLVPEKLRAWHAGVSWWHGDNDINSASIGIEIQNPGHELGYHDFPGAQVEAVIALSRDICRRNGILPERVLAHSDIAPFRKIDPGEKFPWGQLSTAGVGHWVPPAPIRHDDVPLGLGAIAPQVTEMQELLARYGYEIPNVTGILDERTATVIRAFQRHFRPARVDGCIDTSTLDTLRRLGHALPPPVG
jgi:N-acetylmuramoyl-L-alanine amidase